MQSLLMHRKGNFLEITWKKLFLNQKILQKLILNESYFRWKLFCYHEKQVTTFVGILSNVATKSMPDLLMIKHYWQITSLWNGTSKLFCSNQITFIVKFQAQFYYYVHTKIWKYVIKNHQQVLFRQFIFPDILHLFNVSPRAN